MVLDPNLDTVLREVAAGNPVLVLQNLGVASVPLWHYAVVVGFDSEGDTLILRSGEDAQKHISAHRFTYSWSLAKSWAVIVVRPETVPVTATPEAFLAAAAGLEAAHRTEAALAAYRAAHEHWPDDVTAVLGIGNAHYAAHRLPEAEGAYRAALALAEHNAVARNNLAQVLLDQGDPEAALGEILRARSDLSDARFADMADPWNSPGVFWKLLRWLGRENSPMLLRLRAVPSLVGWGLRFIRYSSPRHYRDNTLRNARLALYSLHALKELRAGTRIEYDGATVGTLRLFRRHSEMEEARVLVDWLGQHGVHSRTLDREATIAMSALGDALLEVTGAIRINYAIFGNLDPALHAQHH